MKCLTKLTKVLLNLKQIYYLFSLEGKILRNRVHTYHLCVKIAIKHKMEN